MTRLLNIICLSAIVLLSACAAAAQSGGTIKIVQSVIANGGGASSGGTIHVTSTTGQPAGGPVSGGTIASSNGFWNAAIVPLAANVQLSGRVLSPNGGGVSGVNVVLTDSHGVARYALTNGFGIYYFPVVPTLEVYTIQISSKKFSYQARTLTIIDELLDVDFTPLP